jgi:hypothetical protein
MTIANQAAAPTLAAAALVDPMRQHIRKGKEERPNRKEQPCRGL